MKVHRLDYDIIYLHDIVGVSLLQCLQCTPSIVYDQQHLAVANNRYHLGQSPVYSQAATVHRYVWLSAYLLYSYLAAIQYTEVSSSVHR